MIIIYNIYDSGPLILKRSPGATSGSSSTGYSASFVISAGASGSTTTNWGVAESVTPIPTQMAGLPTKAALTLRLAEYVCRMDGTRIVCYSPIARKCVFLRAGRKGRPEHVSVQAGGTTTLSVCQGYETFEEV